ncbi:hypothetical protein ACGYLV_16040, partial [Sulfitobacter sp. M21595]|uniref:hypothetical protein n=1 Tax=Sulfitobacter sp. M21595 TaxID=3368574 RepID=UPI0037453897
YRKFTDDHRAFDDVLRRLMKGADATKSATRSYTSPWDMTHRYAENWRGPSFSPKACAFIRFQEVFSWNAVGHS